MKKRWEARAVVQWMIRSWGLQALRMGQGVVEVGGDPGFVAAECCNAGIPVTIVDPAWGCSGKANPWAWTGGHKDATNGVRVIREPFDQVFVGDPEYNKLIRGASALVALYPDEATDFVLRCSAEGNLRTALIPCPECMQFFPRHNPTYRGFVDQLLANDWNAVGRSGTAQPLWEDRVLDAPFCQVILQRSPQLTVGATC